MTSPLARKQRHIDVTRSNTYRLKVEILIYISVVFI